MRVAGPSDVPALVAIGQAIADEAKPVAMPFSATASEKWVRAVIAHPTNVCLIEESANGSDGLIVGAVLGGLNNPPMAPAEIEAVCEYIWVRPEYRHGRTAIRLLLAFKGWAIENGAKVVFFSSSTGADLDPLARIVGAVCVGRNYRMAL